MFQIDPWVQTSQRFHPVLAIWWLGRTRWSPRAKGTGGNQRLHWWLAIPSFCLAVGDISIIVIILAILTILILIILIILVILVTITMTSPAFTSICWLAVHKLPRQAHFCLSGKCPGWKDGLRLLPGGEPPELDLLSWCELSRSCLGWSEAPPM